MRWTNLSWQLLCHPANLQVLKYRINSGKGRHSEFDPQTLSERVIEYNNKYGEVELPEITIRLPLSLIRKKKEN